MTGWNGQSVEAGKGLGPGEDIPRSVRYRPLSLPGLSSRLRRHGYLLCWIAVFRMSIMVSDRIDGFFRKRDQEVQGEKDHHKETEKT